MLEKVEGVSWIVLACLGVGLLGGCATTEKVPVGAVGKTGARPVWVDQSSAAFPGDEGKFVYGVGISAESINPAMKREKADHRSRVSVSRGINTYVASFTKDFMVDYPDYFNPDASGSEEYTARVSREVSEATLRGCQVVNHWQDVDGTLYALARVPKDQTDELLKSKMRAIKGALLEAKTNEALGQLDEELKKIDLRQEKEAQKLGLGKPIPKVAP